MKIASQSLKPKMSDNDIARIASALERMSPAGPEVMDFNRASAFIWQTSPMRLDPVPRVNRLPIDLLLGIDRSKETLLQNTLQFSKGLPANNALLWGARGMGKSSLVKAVHGHIGGDLKLIEILREDLPSLNILMNMLREADERFILFCDDLSFDGEDAAYKSLKAVLDGGIEGRPENVIFYATSNRRHLMPRDMIENERSTAINPSEAVEEKVSLSDRFGLWLGFHPCDQDQYLSIIRTYCSHFGLNISEDELWAEAIEWQQTRGARSGRVAWQFFNDIAGRKGLKISL